MYQGLQRWDLFTPTLRGKENQGDKAPYIRRSKEGPCFSCVVEQGEQGDKAPYISGSKEGTCFSCLSGQEEPGG